MLLCWVWCFIYSYAGCGVSFIVMLSVIMLNVVMLNVIMLSVIMLCDVILNVVAPLYEPPMIP
jgi:hypothetical protein